MPGCGERHHEAGRSDLHFRSVNTAVPTGTSERSNRKSHRNSIRITVVLCWSRAELNSPKIIFSRWFWNIWTVSVRNGESRIHAVDGETACQRAVKRRFFRFGYKLATWSQSLEGLQPRGFEACEAEIKRLEKYLFAVLIISYRREFVKLKTVLRIADVPLAPPFIAGEMRVDGMAAGRFGYRRLQRLFDLVLLLAKALFLCVLF